jgi:hypothetical protein
MFLIYDLQITNCFVSSGSECCTDGQTEVSATRLAGRSMD